MNSDQKRRKEDFDTINNWWNWIKPYWHVFSFFILLVFMAATNWTKISAYDGRLIALELWRIDISAKQEEQGRDIAVIKQNVSDIHEYLMPNKTESE
jgi:hypothetical protein